ncbi:MAG: hypothetical protein H0T73_15620 [Ardenticatenales bacterium]|nr:hypothetical protein [Ardenticatenales bacterium]
MRRTKRPRESEFPFNLLEKLIRTLLGVLERWVDHKVDTVLRWAARHRRARGE